MSIPAVQPKYKLSVVNPADGSLSMLAVSNPAANATHSAAGVILSPSGVVVFETDPKPPAIVIVDPYKFGAAGCSAAVDPEYVKAMAKSAKTYTSMLKAKKPNASGAHDTAAIDLTSYSKHEKDPKKQEKNFKKDNLSEEVTFTVNDATDLELAAGVETDAVTKILQCASTLKNARRTQREKAKKAARKVANQALKQIQATAAAAEASAVAAEPDYFKLTSLTADKKLKAHNAAGEWQYTTYHFASRLDCQKLASQADRNKVVAVGDEHVWKRLNFAHIMFSYVEQIADRIQAYTFPENPVTGQFAATAYYNLDTYKSHPKGSNNERVHIALLNKIVIEDDEGDTHRIFDRIIVNEVETNTLVFFNTCDIMSNTANAIDGCMEHHLRKKAVALCTQVKDGAAPATASQALAEDYLTKLKEIFTMKEPKDSLAVIKAKKNEATYLIQGMIAGVMDFLLKISANKTHPSVDPKFKASGRGLYNLS